MARAEPSRVARAQERARKLGFALSCEEGVGRLLAALAAAVPSGGRVIELGTGAGVGLAWLVEGLGARTDVALVSVDLDAALQAETARDDWPDCVRFEVGDGAERVAALQPFDLIFADAPGGKLSGLSDSIAALRPGGILVLDDMDLSRHDDPALLAALASVREAVLAHPELVVAELAAASGVILAARRAAP